MPFHFVSLPELPFQLIPWFPPSLQGTVSFAWPVQPAPQLSSSLPTLTLPPYASILGIPPLSVISVDDVQPQSPRHSTCIPIIPRSTPLRCPGIPIGTCIAQFEPYGARLAIYPQRNCRDDPIGMSVCCRWMSSCLLNAYICTATTTSPVVNVWCFPFAFK